MHKKYLHIIYLYVLQINALLITLKTNLPTKTLSNIVITNHQFYVGCTKITFETEVRYLGVILDFRLLWNAHIKFLVKKLKTSIATIKHISANILKGCLKSVYHTLFESHLIYGISVWGNTSQANIDKLFRLQKRCIRIIFGDREKFLDKFCTVART